MSVNQDFKDLFRILKDCEVRYLVAGAYAVIYHTEPRYTKDLDIWVEPTPENAEKVWSEDIWRPAERYFGQKFLRQRTRIPDRGST